ncbi:MAG: Abi family protein [Anaerovoracaceae bacterium]
MENIIYTTPEEQIQKLKSQNLIINDEKKAAAALYAYGYSNLIKSYREPYIIRSENATLYRSGVTFEQIYSLYILDKNLRNAVIAAMLDLEEHIKEQASDVVADSFGIHPDEYLKYRNYRNKRKRKEQFTLSSILTTMRKALDTDKDPIHHYNTMHGTVPPWILFKSIYFSTIINYIDQFKVKERIQMAHKLYNLSAYNIDEHQAVKLMMDTLYLASDYRNLAAHGGRVYNYGSKNRLRTDGIINDSVQPSKVGFNQLLLSLELLNYGAPAKHIQSILNEQLNRHCNLYPQDVTYLGQILNMDIVQKCVVFMSDHSDKFHRTPYCSGIKNAQEVDYDEAISKGYKPCKRCIKDK